MHYTELATYWSNEIHFPLFWYYFDLHGNTTRMSNDPRVIMKEKTTTLVTMAPAKASLKKINRKVGKRYRQWLTIRKLQKWCLKIPEAISEGGEKKKEVEEAEAEADANSKSC
mmetsp:Transcript_22277/g.23851  ORF Transcript_22277/g.23851 Transcript_22277/m.23851 type:complete len:113 (-) Transcript_22277:58-396(-)